MYTCEFSFINFGRIRIPYAIYVQKSFTTIIICARWVNINRVFSFRVTCKRGEDFEAYVMYTDRKVLDSIIVFKLSTNIRMVKRNRKTDLLLTILIVSIVA